MSYTAVCERIGGWWEITVPELPSGRVTQARRLKDVEVTVQDLVSLMTGVEAQDVQVEIKVADQPRHNSLVIAAIGAAAAATALLRHLLPMSNRDGSPRF